MDGYDDIHGNVRYWIETLLAAVAHDTPAPVLYDVGANDGELSVNALARVRTATRQPRVIAFEPGSAARARLFARLSDAGLSGALWGEADCTLVPVALGDRDASVEIEFYSDDTFSSLYHRPQDDLTRYELTVTERRAVRMRRLDDLVADGVVPPPDLVKIDVEGAERAVLQGAAETLTRYQPPILMEYSCINTENAGYQREELLEALTAAGYTAVYGLYRNTDRALYRGAALTRCQIWNVIAIAENGSDAVRTVVESAVTEAPLPA